MMQSIKVILVGFLATLFLSRCASQPAPDLGNPPPKSASINKDILEEVDDKAPVSETTLDPAYTQLMQLLASLGYQGLGLEFEPRERLNFLIQVFSHPKAANRNLRLVYTGVYMSYDLKHQSLTVGQSTDLQKVIAYIEKNIKLKKAEAPKKAIAVPKASPTKFPKKPVEAGKKLKKQTPEPPPAPVEFNEDRTPEAPSTPSVETTPEPTKLPSETPTEPESSPQLLPNDAPGENPLDSSPSTQEEVQPKNDE